MPDMQDMQDMPRVAAGCAMPAARHAAPAAAAAEAVIPCCARHGLVRSCGAAPERLGEPVPAPALGGGDAAARAAASMRTAAAATGAWTSALPPAGGARLSWSPAVGWGPPARPPRCRLSLLSILLL